MDLINHYPLASYDSVDACIDDIVAYQCKVATGRGVLTSVSFIFAPFLALPGSVCFAWLTQARLAGAIAKAYGYDIESPKVRSMIMCALLGDPDKVREVLRSGGADLMSLDRAGAGVDVGADVGAGASASAGAGAGLLAGGQQLKEMVTPSQSEMRLIVQAALGETSTTASLKLLERLVVERLLLMAGAQASTRAASKLALGAAATIAIDVYQLKGTLDCAKSMFSRPALPDPPDFGVDTTAVKVLFGAEADAAEEQRVRHYDGTLASSGGGGTDASHRQQLLPVDWGSVTKQQPRIYIPRVFSNVGAERLAFVVEHVLKFGVVSHVEMLPGPIDDFKRALIHMRGWNDATNPEAKAVRTKLLEQCEVTVIYDDPWFWELKAGRYADDEVECAGTADAIACGADLAKAEYARIEASIKARKRWS